MKESLSIKGSECVNYGVNNSFVCFQISHYLGKSTGPIAEGEPEAPRAKMTVKSGNKIEVNLKL